jgi:hypothetical protein
MADEPMDNEEEYTRSKKEIMLEYYESIKDQNTTTSEEGGTTTPN